MAKAAKKGGTPKKLTYDAVVKALEESGNVKTDAARLLNVHRSTLYDFIADNPTIKDVIEEIDEVAKDTAEAVVMKAIRENDVNTAKWFLEKRADDRGYGHRTKLTGPKGGPIEVEGSVTVDWSKVSTEAMEAIVAARVAEGEDEA